MAPGYLLGDTATSDPGVVRETVFLFAGSLRRARTRLELRPPRPRSHWLRRRHCPLCRVPDDPGDLGIVPKPAGGKEVAMAGQPECVCLSAGLIEAVSSGPQGAPAVACEPVRLSW